MAKLTKAVREKILKQNDGYTDHTSYNSRNHSYERDYKVSDGKLHIRERGKTSWADSRYDKSWEASEDETHRYLYENQWKMNTEGID